MTRQRARTTAGLALVAAAIGLVQCDRQRGDSAVVDGPFPKPRPASQTVLNRAELVAALAEAGSMFAAGSTAAAPMIAGRSFEIRLPFGCGGPDMSEPGTAGLARWVWSPDRASIRLTLTPANLTRSPLVVSAGQTPTWDQVEGYWIARPWLAGDACPRSTPAGPALAPAAARSAEPAGVPGGPVIEIRPLTLPPSPQTAGVVVIQGAEASRLGREQGQAYSFVVRGRSGRTARPPADGYRLVLSGRVGSFPDGRAIRCTSDGPDRRPVCLAAVELDRVAFEDAAGALLSEWRPN